MRLLAVMMGVVLMAGCASMGSVSGLKGHGHVGIYDVPYEEVWAALPRAMESLKLSVGFSDEKQGKIVTDTPLTLWSYGEAIAVFVERAGNSQTRVEVVSRKKMGTNIFAFSYQDRILDALDKELNTQSARPVSEAG